MDLNRTYKTTGGPVVSPHCTSWCELDCSDGVCKMVVPKLETEKNKEPKQNGRVNSGSISRMA
jgi:hypothetical protein